jgi:hypothetical protein
MRMLNYVLEMFSLMGFVIFCYIVLVHIPYRMCNLLSLWFSSCDFLLIVGKRLWKSL